MTTSPSRFDPSDFPSTPHTDAQAVHVNVCPLHVAHASNCITMFPQSPNWMHSLSLTSNKRHHMLCTCSWVCGTRSWLATRVVSGSIRGPYIPTDVDSMLSSLKLNVYPLVRLIRHVRRLARKQHGWNRSTFEPLANCATQACVQIGSPHGGHRCESDKRLLCLSHPGA